MVSGLKTNRRGEGWRMKMLVSEFVATKGPHPPFGHLLPSCGREKANFNVLPLCRRRPSVWRLIFRFTNGVADAVDLVDYH